MKKKIFTSSYLGLLKYYVDMAKELEKAGAHILGIKDMSALLKPYAAHKLVKALKNEIRSEEHTSELQSRLNLVCRLLLEKKKHYADTFYR